MWSLSLKYALTYLKKFKYRKHDILNDNCRRVAVRTESKNEAKELPQPPQFWNSFTEFKFVGYFKIYETMSVFFPGLPRGLVAGPG